jgi:hypothetical protein
MKRNNVIILSSIMAVIIIGAGVGTYFLYLELSQTTPLEVLDFPGAPRSVPNGSIYNNSYGMVIMELNGSYYEMGYAHGQLLGEFIKYSVEYSVRGILGGDKDHYNELLTIMDDYVNKSTAMHSRELQGMIDGVTASGYDRFVPYLGRNWTINDLWVLNTVQDWNQYYCSGFGAWGAATNTTLDGRTIIGRDLDFHIDPKAYITQAHTIIIYHGNGSRNTIQSFAWPGVITCGTAFNEHGVWISSDNSNGLKTEEEGRTPMGICMRNFLEQEDGYNVTQDAIDYFLAQKPHAPFLFLLGSNETTNDPVVVLEGNDNQVVARTGTEENHDYVFLTNHQRKLMTPKSCYRYSIYEENFIHYTSTSDNSISVTEAIIMLNEGGAGTRTINCVLFFPDTLEFRVGYTRVVDPSNIKSLVGGPEDPLLELTFKLL